MSMKVGDVVKIKGNVSKIKIDYVSPYKTKARGYYLANGKHVSFGIEDLTASSYQKVNRR